MRLFAFCFLIQTFVNSLSQEIELTNSISFKDGIYLSSEEFSSNSPSVELSDISYLINNTKYPGEIRLSNLFYQNPNYAFLDTTEIWGICYNGNPYFNTYIDTLLKPEIDFNGKTIKPIKAYYFMRIMLIGHLSHFSYEIESDYLFMDSNAPLDNRFFFEFIIKASTGEVLPFTPNNILDLIKEDEHLYNKYKRKSYRGIWKNKFYIFYEFNKRNPHIINNTKTSANQTTPEFPVRKYSLMNFR